MLLIVLGFLIIIMAAVLQGEGLIGQYKLDFLGLKMKSNQLNNFSCA